MRKGIVAAVAVVGVLALGGLAYAALGGPPPLVPKSAKSKQGSTSKPSGPPPLVPKDAKSYVWTIKATGSGSQSQAPQGGGTGMLTFTYQGEVSASSTGYSPEGTYSGVVKVTESMEGGQQIPGTKMTASYFGINDALLTLDLSGSGDPSKPAVIKLTGSAEVNLVHNPSTTGEVLGAGKSSTIPARSLGTQSITVVVEGSQATVTIGDLCVCTGTFAFAPAK